MERGEGMRGLMGEETIYMARKGKITKGTIFRVFTSQMKCCAEDRRRKRKVPSRTFLVYTNN